LYAQKRYLCSCSGLLKMPMKRCLLIVLCVAALAGSVSAQAPRSVSPIAQNALGKIAPRFLENRGQWDKRARYLLQSGNVNLWVTDSGMVYDLYRTTHSAPFPNRKFLRPGEQQTPIDTATRKGHVVAMSFLNTTHSKATASTPLGGTTNYFFGSDPKKWVTGAQSFSDVKIQNLYQGIDAVFYLDQGQPRYDIVLQPGADLAKIAMKFSGQDALLANNTRGLTIKTSIGDIEERGLYAYQATNGTKQPIDCAFKVSEDGKVSFAVGKYDPSQPLVIDPIIWSTYVGGYGNPQIVGMALDGKGEVVVTGEITAGNSSSYEFPTTNGAYEVNSPRQGSEGQTIFVTKLNATGSDLIYSTYLGGDTSCTPEGIALDSSGNAIIVGSVVVLPGDSACYPTTADAFQRTASLGYHAFVTKLNATGTGLVYSTLLTGDATDWADGVAADAMGDAYVCGATDSTQPNSHNFPTTEHAFQKKCDGVTNAFVTKLNANGTALIYSTLLGGSGWNGAGRIAIDNSGNAYITGGVEAYPLHPDDFPITSGAFQSVNHGNDLFVVKFDPAGEKLVYSTYLGGSAHISESGLAIDPQGNAYIAGQIYAYNPTYDSIPFPTTGGPFQTKLNGESDGFISKLNPSGTGLTYSMLLGGSGDDGVNSLAVNSAGEAIVSGYTSSAGQYPAGFPTTADTYSVTASRDYYFNASFLTKLSPSGTSLEYSTFFNGSEEFVVYDPSGDFYLAGHTTGDVPTTPNAYQSNMDASSGLFVARLTTFNPLAYLKVDTLPTPFCNSVSSGIEFVNRSKMIMTFDSVIALPPFFVAPGVVPFTLQDGDQVHIPIEIITDTGGAVSSPIEVLYHTSDGAYHDTIVMAYGSEFIPLKFPMTSGVTARSPRDTAIDLSIELLGTINGQNVKAIGFQTFNFQLYINTEFLNPDSLIATIPGETVSKLSTSNGTVTFSCTVPADCEFTDSVRLATLRLRSTVPDSVSATIHFNSATVTLTGDVCTALIVPDDVVLDLAPAAVGSIPSASSSLRLESIHPNPVTESGVSLEILGARNGSVDVTLYDVLGREVRSQNCRISSTSGVQLDLSGLPSGSYVARVVSGSSVVSGRLEVQK
jgi:hypothetical protein